MALLGNHSVLNKSPGRWLNGNAAAGGGIATMRSNFNKHGMQRGAYGAYSAKSATPDGHLSPSAWVMPKTAGGMSSRNVTTLNVSPTAVVVGGVTADAVTSLTFTVADVTAYPLDDSSPLRTGSSTLTFTVADATGQLISSGAGFASFAFSSNTPLLTASLSAEGAANFDFAGAAMLSGIGDMAAASSLSFAPTASILPTNDASPLRTGTSSFVISGAVVPYAIGSMSGSTVDTSILTSDGIAQSVWAAIATANNDAGTMGAKLNSAASGGVDYEALGLAVWASVSRTLTAGAAPTAEQIATAVLAAAQTTPIYSDMRRVKGQAINRAGSEADPWGP